MVFLANRNNGIFYIIDEKQGRQKYLKKLGRIPKEEAQEQLTIWKKKKMIEYLSLSKHCICDATLILKSWQRT